MLILALINTINNILCDSHVWPYLFWATEGNQEQGKIQKAKAKNLHTKRNAKLQQKCIPEDLHEGDNKNLSAQTKKVTAHTNTQNKVSVLAELSSASLAPKTVSAHWSLKLNQNRTA